MAASQTNPGTRSWDTLLDLSQRTGPLHHRLTDALRDSIRSGQLPRGTALPPSRSLAADLGCSRWTVTQAYGQLTVEGYLEGRTGSATLVAWEGEPQGAPRARPTTSAPVGPVIDLAPGLPDLSAFPRQSWAHALSTVVRTVPVEELRYPRPHGVPVLQQTLSAYLRRTRGASIGPRDVSVGISVTDWVRRICVTLRARGITGVGFEEPGWSTLRTVLEAAGMDVVPVPVDGDGLRVDRLRASGVRAVVVTPAHQFPTGAVLSAERRVALLQWARDVDGLVVEDDYDAEFRYDRRPVGTLQGMDPSRVVLVKSLSKMLSPALGIGWAVTPPAWTDAIRDVPGATPPTLDQHAFEQLLSSGAYHRHLRLVRARYRTRRDRLVDALGTRLPACAVTGVAAGLHLTVELPEGVDAGGVVARAARRSLRLVELGDYHAGGASPRPALVLGYGNLADTQVTAAVDLLAASIEEQAPGPGLRRTRRAGSG